MLLPTKWVFYIVLINQCMYVGGVFIVLINMYECVCVCTSYKIDVSLLSNSEASMFPPSLCFGSDDKATMNLILRERAPLIK